MSQPLPISDYVMSEADVVPGSRQQFGRPDSYRWIHRHFIDPKEKLTVVEETFHLSWRK